RVERIAVDYNKCIIDRSSGLAHQLTSPRSGASHEHDEEDLAGPDSGRSSSVLGDHARGAGQRRGREPGCSGKGGSKRSDLSGAWSRSERESRAGDFGQIRDGRGQVGAFRLYNEGRQVFRGERPAEQRCGRQDGADWRRRGLHRGTESERGDGQGEGLAAGSGAERAASQRRLPRGQRHALVEGWPRRRRSRTRKGRGAQDGFGPVVTRTTSRFVILPGQRTPALAAVVSTR